MVIVNAIQAEFNIRLDLLITLDKGLHAQLLNILRKLFVLWVI